MKLAKADLVPKDTNLLAEYASFAELEAACEVFCGQVNARVHRVTRRAPIDMLAEEQARLHRLPRVPHTVAFGVTRTVAAKTPMVAFEGGQYSVPARTAARRSRSGSAPTVSAWASRSSSCTSATPARSRWPGTPRHAGQPAAGRRAFPARAGRALDRAPKARTAAEASSSPSVTAPGCG